MILEMVVVVCGGIWTFGEMFHKALGIQEGAGNKLCIIYLFFTRKQLISFHYVIIKSQYKLERNEKFGDKNKIRTLQLMYELSYLFASLQKLIYNQHKMIRNF